MKTYWWVEVQPNTFLTLGLDRGEGRRQASTALPVGKEPPVTTG
jgi:hypothetical protein